MTTILAVVIAAGVSALVAWLISSRPRADDIAAVADVSPEAVMRFHLTGSRPYTVAETAARRNIILRQISDIVADAAELGIDEEQLFAATTRSGGSGGAGGGSAVMATMRDNGSLGEEGPAPTSTSTTGTTPCCTQAQIDAGLVAIRAAYATAVAGLTAWKGCQDLSEIVRAAVQPVLPPCWVGKFVFRMKVYPFGKFFPGGDGDTWVHHAYAVCPCTCPSFGGCPECIVLDPYSITGFNLFQTASEYPFDEWIKDGNIWRATTAPVHDNVAIYSYAMRFYCQRAATGTAAQRAICHIVRDLLMRELARYTGATGAVLQAQYQQAGFIPNCCP